MIWTALADAGGFLKRLPWQLYAALAIVLVAWAWGNHRYSQGYDDRTAEYAEAARTAKARADAATVGAAGTRASDTIANTEAERARNEATVTRGRIGRDCERLRQAGADLNAIAACR